MSLSRRSIRRIFLPPKPCSSLRSHSQQNIYSQLEQSPLDYSGECDLSQISTTTQPSVDSTSKMRKDDAISLLAAHLPNRHYELSKTVSSIDKFDGSFVTSLSEPIRKMLDLFKPLSDEKLSKKNVQQPVYIHDEHAEDAIYKIYFKQIKPKSSSDDENEQDQSTNTNKGTLLYSTIKIRQLKAGTIEKIVECLTNENGNLDTLHMHILFSTYRTYTSTRTLVDEMLFRYQSVIPASLDMTETVRQKTLQSLSLAFKCLLSSYKEDFYEPPAYSILNYIIKKSLDQDVKNQSQDLLERFINEGERVLDSNSNRMRFNLNVDSNNNSNSSIDSKRKPYDSDSNKFFLDVSSRTIAEQLTIIDADLLKRVLIYECLTDEKHSAKQGLNPTCKLSTVDKTIEQFNYVVNCVTVTILIETNATIRVRIIQKWIDVAQECRELKNFSSLTAILASLESGPIHRLTTSWSTVDSKHRAIFNDLKSVFISGDKRQQVRAILDKQLDEIRLNLPECSEGTAKHGDIDAAIDATFGKKFRPKKLRYHQNTMIGTVPYLGFYLYDLNGIHSAHDNYLDSNKSKKRLINFEKHRKKFQVLAQIKLFQSATNAYRTLCPSFDFKEWFHSIHMQNELENWNLSYEIEPKGNTDFLQQKSHDNPPVAYRSIPLKAFPSQTSLESLSISNNLKVDRADQPDCTLRASPSLISLDKMSVTSMNLHPQRQTSINSKEKKIFSNHSRSSSTSSSITNASSSQGYISAQTSPAISVAYCTFDSVDNDSLIAKVQLTGRNELLYKKIRIGNSERAHNILKTILEKFNLDPSNFDRYCIEQQLPDRKLILPDNCNVFYAIVHPPEVEQIELIVREKTRQEQGQTKLNVNSNKKTHKRTPSGFSIASTDSR